MPQDLARAASQGKGTGRRRENCVGRAWEPAPTDSRDDAARIDPRADARPAHTHLRNDAARFGQGSVARKGTGRRRENCVGRAWEPAPYRFTRRCRKIWPGQHRKEGIGAPTRDLRRGGRGEPAPTDSRDDAARFGQGSIARKGLGRRRENCVGRAWEPAPTDSRDDAARNWPRRHRKGRGRGRRRENCVGRAWEPAPTHSRDDAARFGQGGIARKGTGRRRENCVGRGVGAPPPTHSRDDAARFGQGGIARKGTGRRRENCVGRAWEPAPYRAACQDFCMAGQKPRQGGHKGPPPTGGNG